jgi:hypothetical protein
MSWGEKLVKGLDSETPLDQNAVLKFLENNPRFLEQLTPKSDESNI